MKVRSNMWTVMKKELRRFFGDRRMVLTVLLPGILIYVIYSLMGGALMDNIMGDTPDEYRIAATEGNIPLSMDTLMPAAAEAAEVTFGYWWDLDDPMAAVRDGEVDVYVVFDENFDAAVAAYDPASGLPAPQVQIYYNSSDAVSQAAYSFLAGVLDIYESGISNCMDINRDPSVTYDLAAPEDITGMMFSMLMPMLLVMLMFSGCMAMTTEAIAGEKERGTIATLLVTPLRRSDLAIGKIAALSMISLLSGLCSFLGVLLALPKLMGDEAMGMVDASVYGVTDYAMILVVILSTVLVFVSAIAVLSAMAGSVKEAGGLITPLMLVVMVIGVSGMFTGGDIGLGFFLIPVYNSVQCISGVFSMDYAPIQILLTVLSNFATAGLLAFLLTRMFHSERVMFKK